MIAYCQHGFYTCSFIGQVSFCKSCDGGQNYQMKEKERKPGRGGSRPGPGRPELEPTTTLSYRVPAIHAEPIDKEVRKVISRFLPLPKGLPNGVK